jgi:hypothetical protein
VARAARRIRFISGSSLSKERRIRSRLANLDIVPVAGRSPEALLEEAFGGPEDIVIVDTLRHALRFSQEADNSEIAAQVTPWIERAREKGKTFLGLHRQTKAGGEHGRGLAGGHALLGVFDMAIEVDRARNAPTRRRGSGLGRLDPIGVLRAGRWAHSDLGEVSAVIVAEVRRRTLESLSDVAQEFKAIHDHMEELAPRRLRGRDHVQRRHVLSGAASP